MSELNRLRDLLEDFGIPYEVNTYSNNQYVSFGYDYCKVIGESENVTSHPKIAGYFGFYSSFVFDLDGKFIKAGAWE